ncbi:PucR family transcriptional regulator [Skermania sp. ID1734]|uniref:PucR family transcriptional regulator n=1 Tax=Skermania sp. ID1734 TaxID=2597516 RepID=UPI00117F71E0|nr:PucR family transcriptional regulator [Skermania sp. ID1734]TSD96575.1 PucR family transcriptional regulator [Skermania sp. ID1734]
MFAVLQTVQAHMAVLDLPAKEVLGVNGSWDRLFDTLLAEQVAVSARVREAMQAQIPNYRGLPLERLDVEVGVEVERVLRSARAGKAALDDAELAELAAIGEARAHQGVPVADVLRAWRIGVEVVVAYARDVAQRHGIDDAQVLEFVQSVLAWSDVAMVTTAGAHRRAELALAVAEEERRAAFVRSALRGTVPAAELRVHAEAYGLDPAGQYVAVRARLVEGATRDGVEQALGFRGTLLRRRGLSALIDGDICGFSSQPPPADVEGVVGYGPAVPLDRLPESHQLAARALMTAQAFGLRGAYDLDSLGLRAAVATDSDIGEIMRRRYLEPLGTGGAAEEVIATMRVYLACGMHSENTAARLFVHRNTVRYRLARFEELTGANLREPAVLFEVWWALELAAMGR